MSDATSTSDSPSSATLARTPPYVSFQTLLTLIEDLKTNGLPQKLDKSVLKRFSGGVGSQLLIAARALNLLDEKDRPTPTLKALVEAHGTDAFKATLKPAIEAGYPFLAGVDLITATPSMFADIFKSSTAAKEDVLRKCRTFYIHAARYVGIEIGPRLASSPGRPSGSGGGKRRKAGRPKNSESPELNGAAPETPLTNQRRRHSEPLSIQERLLDKFPKFDPKWSPEIQTAWFAGFDKFMTAAKGNGDQK
ncbi:MAG: hypothetical protein ACHQAY_10220 [Hyphomicrobiales bacterium]